MAAGGRQRAYTRCQSAPQAIYTAQNCQAAYQLNWSLSLFPSTALPEKSEWLTALAEVTEADGVRLLECHQRSERVVQFMISTLPEVSPSAAIRSVKGRLQHLLRHQIPQAFRRNYRLESVGEVNNRVLQAYVTGQVQRHPMADSRVAQRLAQLQFHDDRVDLSVLRYSAHGQFIFNLHLVLENAGHLHDVRQEALAGLRAMLVRACDKKSWLLSRIGMVSNHMHVLLGCDVVDSPREIALSLMNNLAYAQGMKSVFEFSYYAGTFGNYDRDAIRRMLGSG
jgi:REP element-mobilizing transposase RayT